MVPTDLKHVLVRVLDYTRNVVITQIAVTLTWSLAWELLRGMTCDVWVGQRGNGIDVTATHVVLAALYVIAVVYIICKVRQVQVDSDVLTADAE